jgi:CubicO group peptidase (beta-lactamase class C family)
MIAILLALTLTAHVDAQTGEPPQSIEAFIDQVLPASRAPGLAYAIMEEGVVRAGARGEMLLGGGRPVAEDTAFSLGSISKSFTAMAVLQLVEAGQVGLDVEISAYLDEFEGRPGGAVTIRQLLSHTSGYSTLQGNQSHTDQTGRDDELADRVRGLAAAVPAFEAGRQWRYSNANYLVLGRLIEVVSGRDFAGYVQAEILEPAGMTNSFVAGGGTHESIATGHTPWFTGRRPVPEGPASNVMAPAGGVIGTAADVVRYLAIMANGEDDLISAANKAMMLQSASEASPFYGLGWFIDEANDVAYHTGLSPGVETIAALSRSEPKGVVVLINANSGMGFGVTGDLLAGVSALALGQTYEAGGGHLGPQLLYLMLLVTPVGFLAGIIVAGILRAGLRAKSGLSGLLSLWFPLLATLAMSWIFLVLMPSLFGVPLATLYLYQPDMAILLVAGSATGVTLAVFRLGLFYLGRSRAAGV